MFTIILIGEPYEAHDFCERVKNVIHQLEIWEQELRTYGYWYNVKHFDTEEKMNAYISAIGDVENYLSDDFYTFGIITNNQIIK